MHWFNVTVNVDLPRFWLQVSTPNFTITNPKYYPSWYPKFVLEDLNKDNILTDLRYHFTLTWFFHLTVAWGKQTPAKYSRGIMELPKEAALYRFGDGDKSVYMVSTIHNEKAMRAEFHCQDHGGVPYEDYLWSTQHGTIKKIESLSEIPQEDWDSFPYTCGDDILIEFQATLREIIEAQNEH